MTPQNNASLLRKITNFFVQIFDSIVEARRKQAAMETAHHLKSHHSDFRHMSVIDIYHRITSDVTPERK